MRTRSWLVALMPGLIAAGCTRPLPQYPHLDAAAAMRLMTERSQRVKTLASPCRLILTRNDGQSVQLDGALAAQPPDHLRLRAWKVSQPVFDLTLRPDGLWLYVADASDAALGATWNDITADRVAGAWAVLTTGFDADDWRVVADNKDTLHLSASEGPSHGRMECEVSRPALTLRRCDVGDPEGAPRMTLRSDRYRSVNGFVWPARICFDSPRGSITVLLDDPLFNDELPLRAFQPPARAVKKP